MNNPLCNTCPNENKLFCGLREAELGLFSKHKQFKFYKKGEVIFTIGKRARGLFCIYQGKVKLSKTGEEGRDVITRLINKGEVLGYRALLADDFYRNTATAIEDCYICKISRKVFLEVLRGSRHLSHNIIEMLTNDLKQSEESILSHSQASVKQRIARALLLLKTKFGLENDGETIAVYLTRREVSEIAGTTTESAIRSLSDLDKTNIIKLTGKKMAISDFEELTVIANLPE